MRSQDDFKRQLVGCGKDLKSILERGYLAQGLDNHKEKIYEDLFSLWFDKDGNTDKGNEAFERISKILKAEAKQKALLPDGIWPLSPEKRGNLRKQMSLIEKQYNGTIDFIENIRELQELSPPRHGQKNLMEDEANQLMLRGLYKHIFPNILQVFSIALNDTTSSDIWKEANRVLNQFPEEAFVYSGINNTSPKWIINRLVEIVFATECVKESNFNKELKTLNSIRDGLFGYWGKVLNA